MDLQLQLCIIINTQKNMDKKKQSNVLDRDKMNDLAVNSQPQKTM